MKELMLVLLGIIILNNRIIAQSNIDSVMGIIKENNTELLALKKNMEADQINNKTGIYLQNPEVGFNYLWGNSSEVGNRADLSITQSFDFPTAYKYKKDIANLKNAQADFEFKNHLAELSVETRIICLDLIYINALEDVLSKRMIHAKSIADSYKSKFDVGEANILEYNKAQLNLLNTSAELKSVEIEYTSLMSELKRLNAGISIEFVEKEFQAVQIPTDFEELYQQAEQQNPMLNWLKKELELGQDQQKLQKALNLPKFQVGYMSEGLFGVRFQGLTMGLSIPLWENKNRTKSVKANNMAIESMAFDGKKQYYETLKALHIKALALQKNANDYRAKFQVIDNTDLFKKALDNGEISLIEYVFELLIYYESNKKLLEIERDLHKTLAELYKYF